MTDILVTSPFRPFTLPTQFKAVFNGYIYCGTVDAVDPSVSQVQVYLVNESGDKVPVAQPLRTNAGGFLVYNGQPAKFVTDSNHSLLVRNSAGNQVWYEPDVASVDPDAALRIASGVSSIAELRQTGPSFSGQVINVNSYYGGWGAINGGEPKFGGRFWYDQNDSITPDDGFKTIVTAGGARWKRVSGSYSVGHAGAVEDDSVDSTSQVQTAVNGTKSGEELGFYGGPFNFDKVELTKPIVLVGDAYIKHNGFRVKSSRITSRLSGRQICRNYQSSSRAFQALAYEDGADYDDIKILFNRFEGFFYSTDMRGREYEATPSDPTNRVVKNTLVMGCTSIAPSAVPAGHFQHTGVTNAKCIGCSTYGGINATSYNFINGNGYIIVQGCYDQNNTYGSLEIENNQVTQGIVSGNVFGKQLWIDDSSNITITGNAVSDRILVTAQSNDTDNITISGNSCSRISITKFGASPTGRHKSVHIAANTIYGETGSNDVFTDGSVDRVTIENNSMNGDANSAIAMVRSANCNHLARNNRSRTARPLTISGSGGRVIEYGNDNMTSSSASDSRHISNMMVPSVAYLDLPGKYLLGTKYTGNIAPGGTTSIALPIPDGGSLAFRGVGLLVMIRNTTSNDISSYRIDGLYKVVGAAISLAFGPAFSSQGVDQAAVTVANNASTSDSIKILVSNTSGSKTFQVTILPEVSSRLGTEE